ncbi:MAG: cysteine--tRNA ligase [Planctomycetota bacterium]
MTFSVYNSYSKKKEPFEPLTPGRVRMYNCGPTVYNRAHIGNFRSYLFADILRRWLEYRGFEVRQVMNFTDVGHLLDEENDAGEDRVEAQARRENKSPQEICQANIDLFNQDRDALGILPAHENPRASDHVPEMLAIVDDLIAKGHAYEVQGEDGTEVYFDVTSFERYGRLSGNRVDELDDGARIQVRQEKRNPKDFALWKADAKHLQKWESRFGAHGFPGWHIECSAMALKHLDVTIDIHTGGEDNIFPHHECEIAQSECHTGDSFSRYWMHARFLQVDGGKMSKSLGNVYSVDDVAGKGFEPRALRYALIRGHYRQPLNFTWKVMGEAASALEGLDDLARRLHLAAEGQGAAEAPDAGADVLAASRTRFESGMDDDLNTPIALSALFELRTAVLEQALGRDVASEALDFVRAANAVLGVIQTEKESVDDDIQARIDARNAARAGRDFAESDRIRDELLAEGIQLEDTPEGTIWRRASR